MPQYSKSDTDLINKLHELVFEDSDFRSTLETAFLLAEVELNAEENNLPYSSAEIPTTAFKTKLPEHLRDTVNLCRVFILLKGCKMETPEIHRNSIQRLASYTGHGMIHSAESNGAPTNFKSYPLAEYANPNTSNPKEIWDVVPMNTWHYPEASCENDWRTVTFHSVCSATIVDEYTTA